MSDLQVETSDSAFPLELTVNRFGGVTGLSPTVAIRNVSLGPPARYLDWHTMTFATSGWTTKYFAMAEIERGHYQAFLNIASLSLPDGTKLSVEYHVDNGMGIVGDDADTLSLVKTGQQVTFLRKVATNRLEEVSGNPGTLTLYDDDASTVVKTWPLHDEIGGAVISGIGTPARRGAGVP